MSRRLDQLRKRLKNAKRRLAYWSGRPSFSGFGFNPRRHNDATQNLAYETAWADVNSLADDILKITGDRPRVVDVREQYRQAFLAAMEKRPAHEVNH